MLFELPQSGQMQGQDSNLRPPGNEPGELPGCSTLQYCHSQRVAIYLGGLQNGLGRSHVLHDTILSFLIVTCVTFSIFFKKSFHPLLYAIFCILTAHIISHLLPGHALNVSEPDDCSHPAVLDALYVFLDFE